MAYVAYKGLKTPDEVLSKIAEFIKTTDLTIVQDLVDDYDIYTASAVDGKKFAFKISHSESNNKTVENVVVLRSANGTNIFGMTDDSQQNNVVIRDTNGGIGTIVDSQQLKKDIHYEGIGMTVGDAYSATVTWHNQQNTPHVVKSATVLGVFMPITTQVTDISYTLYCNYLKKEEKTLVFSVVRENTFQRQSAHLIVGNLSKYDVWHGGVYFTGSLNGSINDFDMTIKAYKLFEDTYELPEAYTLPVFCQGSKGGTYLQIDIDEAPSDFRGNIHWASSFIDKSIGTGKQLAVPVRNSDSGANVPNYYYMQSKDRLDWGKNNNLLNCITVDLPIYFAVCVDPDVVQDYACCGYCYGLSYISLLNFQTGETYHIDKYNSEGLEQVFTMDKRRGWYGFDGFGVYQEIVESTDNNTSTDNKDTYSTGVTTTDTTTTTSTTTNTTPSTQSTI